MNVSTSIIITSYNYARFLPDAINSALAQSRPAIEVIVVDDGSTDDSPQVIRSFGDRVKPLLKPNAGQASAINAGVTVSRGEVVLLLDSDDVLETTAIEQATACFDDPSVVKVHWPMHAIDEQGAVLDQIVPAQTLSDGDLRADILRDGPEAYEWPPTSGNAWRRSFLRRILPIPEEAYRVCPDVYLAAMVAVAGTIRRIERPQSRWRVHGRNNTWSDPFERRLPRFVRQWDLACDALVAYCRAEGLPADPVRWRERAWCHRVMRSVRSLCDVVPPGHAFVLIDANDWGADESFFGRRFIPFPERGGRQWGTPADDDAAIAELQRLVRAGASFLAVAWPAFWWVDHYRAFMHFVRERGSVAFENDDLLIFDLRDWTCEQID